MMNSSSLPEGRKLEVSDKMKVASGILPFGDYCNSPLSLSFYNTGPVGTVTFIYLYSDGRAGNGLV